MLNIDPTSKARDVFVFTKLRSNVRTEIPRKTTHLSFPFSSEEIIP